VTKKDFAGAEKDRTHRRDRATYAGPDRRSAEVSDRRRLRRGGRRAGDPVKPAAKFVRQLAAEPKK
jgi:hypothetical protein